MGREGDVRRPSTLGVDPVGTREIGERLGQRPETVAQWNHRGLLPPPRWTVGGRPAWHWPDIERWARDTGRLPEPSMKSKGAARGRREGTGR